MPTRAPLPGPRPPCELVPASAYTVEALTEAYNQTRVDYIVPMPMNPARSRRISMTTASISVALLSHVTVTESWVWRCWGRALAAPGSHVWVCYQSGGVGGLGRP